MLLKDKIVKVLLEKAKRRPAIKIPVLAIITCVVGIFHFMEALRRNMGKCLMLASTIMLILFCGSFSNDAVAMEKEKTVTVYQAEDISAYEQGMQISDFIENGEETADTADIDAFIEKTKQEEALSDTKTGNTELSGGKTEDSVSILNGTINSEPIGNSTEDKETDSTSAGADMLIIYDENGNQVEADFAEDWKLILVNKQNPVPEDYEMNLTSINGSMQVDARIAKPLAEMLNAAKEDGVSLIICSAYRSYERQTTLFENKIRRSMRSGLSYLDAYADASYSVTVPGTSEHQLGLALDIVTPSYTSLNEGFENTEAGKWLKANSGEYGFILRYPKGREHITGIIYEPWHFRYVGEQAAKEITENELTLEEYLEQIGMK